MTPDTKRLVLEGLGRLRGDDLERATLSFGLLTPAQMQQQHGQSEFTRQQMIDGYREYRARVDQAIAEVKAL